MVISWNPPLDDGGCAISNYIIEKRDTNRDLWMPVTSSCTRTTCKVGSQGTGAEGASLHHITYAAAVSSLQVPKLIEGREYIIRIMAQNIYGISDPLESVETKARDIYSKNLTLKKSRSPQTSCTISDLCTLVCVHLRGA